ncbi:hypothetical protein KW791_01055 [Candidatus Parcubacteria bacterium]|nr:hypothetical protein [Candidatus Parcubacteria bacterium]
MKKMIIGAVLVVLSASSAFAQTEVKLTLASVISSEETKVGEKISMTLAEDAVINGRQIAAGTTVVGVATMVKANDFGGQPGQVQISISQIGAAKLNVVKNFDGFVSENKSETKKAKFGRFGLKLAKIGTEIGGSVHGGRYIQGRNVDMRPGTTFSIVAQ